MMTATNDNYFGDLVKSIRDVLGKTQPQLTKDINDIIKQQRGLQSKSKDIPKSSLVEWHANKLSEIERGARANIPLIELNLLAQALGLTMRERRGFFASSQGVVEWPGTNEIFGPGSTVSSETKEEILLRFKSYVSNQMFPCFVADQFLNVLMINAPCLEMMGYSEKTLKDLQDAHGKFAFNLMSIIFSERRESAELRSKIGEYALLRNIFLFRTQTIRYRHAKYFLDLYEHLYKFRRFKSAWDESYHKNALEIGMTEGFTIRGERGKDEIYSITLSSALSKYGDLYISLFVPCDDFTLNKFIEYKASSNLTENVFSLGDWEDSTPPKKKASEEEL